MPTIPQEYLVYTLLVLLAVLIVLGIQVIQLSGKVKALSRGRKGENIEQAFKSFEQELTSLQGFRADMEKYLQLVEKRLRRSTQGVATVTFNAFEGLDSGGRQSFATAFLDENGNGLILSTLHARERVNVFAKKVEKFKPVVSLSDEEQNALTQATESCKL